MAIELVLVNGAPDREIGAAEQNCSRDEASADCVDAASPNKSDPVEVVEVPELWENNSALDESLLLGSVKTDSIEQTNLKPCGARVSMGHACFILRPVHSTPSIKLRLVVQLVTTKISYQVLIQLSTLLGNVDSLETIFPPLKVSLLSWMTRYVRHLTY